MIRAVDSKVDIVEAVSVDRDSVDGVNLNVGDNVDMVGKVKETADLKGLEDRISALESKYSSIENALKRKQVLQY